MGIFEKEWTLNFTQCYPNGQLKYSELNNILQVTASEHAEEIGFGYKAMLGVQQSWVLSRMLMEIKRLPKYTQQVKVRTWIQDFTGSRSIRNFQLVMGDEVLVSATSLWVVFNIAKRRADVLALNTDHMEYFRDMHSTMKETEKIDGIVDFQPLGQYRVKLSDLDIVNHANNVKYMEWVFDAMDPKIILASTIRTLEMNFLKELGYGDEIHIDQFKAADDRETYAIQKDGRLHFLMRLTR